MVKDTRATVGPDSLRPLNAPTPLQVRLGDAGAPAQIHRRRRWRTVARTMDRWRIDDEWWRERAISRTYYRVLLEDGQPLTVFRDDETGRWHEQGGVHG